MIEFDKVSTDLYFLGSKIDEITVKNNIVHLSENAKKQLSFDIIEIKINDSEDSHIGQIRIKIVIFVQSEDGVSNIDLVAEGCFSAPKEVDAERFQNLVAINGAAALYSICRSKIEVLSSSVYYTGKLTLPFINILDYYKEQQKLLNDNS